MFVCTFLPSKLYPVRTVDAFGSPDGDSERDHTINAPHAVQAASVEGRKLHLRFGGLHAVLHVIGMGK